MIRAVGRLLQADPEIDRLAPPSAAGGVALPLVAAILAFFASLLLALALAAGSLAASWQGGRADVATLQVFAGPDQIEAQARAALDVLKAAPGVQGVRMIDLAEQERLLEPWLGPDIPLETLPLPVTIEITTDRATFDATALADALKIGAPGSVLDDHAAWREPLVETARRLGLFAGCCLALVATVLAATAGLAGRAAAAGAATAIRALRLIGARDNLIARALARPLARRAELGALAGTAAGMAVLAILPRASEEGFFLVGIGLAGWHWLLPLLIPIAALGLGWLAAGRAVRRGLREWS